MVLIQQFTLSRSGFVLFNQVSLVPWWGTHLVSSRPGFESQTRFLILEFFQNLPGFPPGADPLDCFTIGDRQCSEVFWSAVGPIAISQLLAPSKGYMKRRRSQIYSVYVIHWAFNFARCG